MRWLVFYFKKGCCTFVSHDTTNLNRKAKSLIYFRLYTSLSPYVSKTTYFSVIFHQLKRNATEMCYTVSKKLSSPWAVRWQMAKGSTSNILSEKACECELLRIPCICKQFLLFGQISLGITFFVVPPMIWPLIWGQTISSSCVCQLDYISSDFQHPQLRISQFIWSSYCSPLRKGHNWKISLSGGCLTRTLFLASSNYVSSVTFLKYRSWWLPQSCHACIPTCLLPSLSLYSWCLYQLHTTFCRFLEPP